MKKNLGYTFLSILLSSVSLYSQNISINTDGSSGPELFNVGNTATPPLRIKSTGEILGKDNGTATNPSYSFVGDENLGFYRAAPDELRVVTNGNDRVTINSSGNVGIGVVAPGYLLDINDRIRLRSNGANTAGVWFNNSDNSSLSGFIGSLSTDRIGIYLFGINAWQMVFNRTTGNVGLGTSTPNALFHIRRDGAGEVLRLERADAFPSTYSISNSGNNMTHNYTGTQIIMQQNGNNRLIINNGGASINGALNIFHPTAGNTHLPFTDNNNYITADNTFIRTSDNSSIAQFLSNRLRVFGGIRANRGQGSNNDANNGFTFGNDGDSGLFAYNGTPEDNNVVTLNLNGAQRVWVRAGDCNTAFAFTINSDERIKKEIKRLESPLEKLKLINGYTYFYNNENEFNIQFHNNKTIGLIAQEVESIFPELVQTQDNGMKGIQYSLFAPILLESIKEQQSQIEKLEQELKTKDQDISNLSERLENLAKDFQQLKSELNLSVKN